VARMRDGRNIRVKAAPLGTHTKLGQSHHMLQTRRDELPYVPERKQPVAILYWTNAAPLHKNSINHEDDLASEPWVDLTFFTMEGIRRSERTYDEYTIE